MTARNSVIQERATNPCATLRQIADKYGVTKERVRQILSTENLPTRHWRPRYICNYCGKLFPFFQGHSRLFCCNECKKRYYQATLECEVCGKLFNVSYYVLARKVARLGQQHFYCSQSCKSKKVGLKYRLGINPQNNYNRVKRPRKWAKLAPQIIQKLQKGSHLNTVMKELGIPEGSFCSIKEMLAEYKN